jgi:hypothetical protein
MRLLRCELCSPVSSAEAPRLRRVAEIARRPIDMVVADIF